MDPTSPREDRGALELEGIPVERVPAHCPACLAVGCRDTGCAGQGHFKAQFSLFLSGLPACPSLSPTKACGGH